MIGLGADVGDRLWRVFTTTSFGERSEAELRELFQTERATFERLRDHVLEDSVEVRADSYSWCDGCPSDRATGRPPGVPFRSCDWHGGCVRWVDQPPTAEILAAIKRVTLSRAESYLDDLERVDGILTRREHDGSIVVWMETRGIIPSGSATMIAWTPEGVPFHESDRLLGDRWSIRVE